jgi:hypothetical protein
VRTGLLRAHFVAKAIAATLPLLMVTAAQAQQAAPDSGAAVNQGSPVTEKILKELRASQPDAEPAPVDPAPVTADKAAAQTQIPTPKPASDAAPAEAAKQDGAPPAAAPEAPNTDGQLSAIQQAAPVDGDIAGDGKMAPAPAEASQDPLAEPRLPAIRALPRLHPSAAPRRAARTPSNPARRLIAAEEPPAPADDSAAPDVANDADASEPAPVLRPQIVEEDAEDPYAPVGYKIGSFRLMPSITAETVYSDNVRQSKTNRQADVALVLRPAFTLESEWSRHFVSVDLRGMTSKNMRLSDENNRELNIDVNGRLDIREGTSLDGLAAYEMGKIPHSDPNLPAGATLRPTTTTATLGAGLNHKINRLALRLHGAIAENDQGDTGELSPRLTLTGTAKQIGRRFDNATGTDAVADEVRLGLETDGSAKLSGTFNVGLARVASANSAYGKVNGLVGGANVIWLPSALTTLTFAGSSDLGVTDAVGATAIRTDKLSLDLKHDFRRWLSLMAGISETRRSYPGLELTETERSGHIGLEYDLNRTVALTGDVKRTTLASTDLAKGYAENQVMVGVRLQK